MRIVALLFFISSFLFFSIECEKGEALIEKTPSFSIKNVYSQEQIPGQQNELVRTEIGMQIVDLEENVFLEKVYFNGHFSNQLIKRNEIFKTFLRPEVEERILEIESDEAILFYLEDNKKYYFVLKDVQLKEPIYLP